MTDDSLPTGPDPEAIGRSILERFPDTDVVSAMGATFFSVDPDKHWPNFATIVTTDEHDEGAPSRLTDRPDVFRLNIGVGRESFQAIAGAAGDPPDHAALDRLVPHPVYAKQRWISILNPSEETFREVVVPLLDEAHARVADAQARHQGSDR